MLEINPEWFKLIFDIFLALSSGIIASYLTYVFAIRKTQKENILRQRVDLYRPLIHTIDNIINLPNNVPERKEKLKELQSQINEHGLDLYLFAPDNIYNAFKKAMGSIQKGASVKELCEFMIILRKELIGKTKLNSEDVFSIEFY